MMEKHHKQSQTTDKPEENVCNMYYRQTDTSNTKNI